MSLRPLLAASLLPVAVACRAPAAHELDSTATPRADDRGAVIEAVQRGEYREARRLLAGLIVADDVRRADEALAAGDGEQAMLLLDEALELAPADPELLALRGEAAFAAAEAVLADPSSGSNPQLFYEDALEHLTRAGAATDRGDGPAIVRLAFAASRAARRIPDPERALQLARGGAERLARLDPRPALEPPPERTHAEAAFDVYLARLREGGDAQEFYLETEDQLTRLLGRRPADPWPRQQLSNLYQWNGDLEGAIAQVERALELSPAEQALHGRLMELVPAERGWPALVEWYGAFADEHPRSASVRRNAGVAAFFGAMASFDQGEYDVQALRAAEREFELARELDPAWRQDCLGYQAIVRNAIGWCHFNRGELGEARAAFLSMEDLFEGGLAWWLEDRLPDGITGLGFVIGKLAEDPNSPSALGHMVEAAAIADYLFAYRPDDGNHANNAGFMNRDAAVLFERKSRVVRGQALQAPDDEARRELEREAERLMNRAYELMDRSEAAYRVAARLLPDDVRVINDAGLVMVYYTRDDVAAAERYLLRAVELGGPQLEDPTLSGEDRAALNEAWGDAHQNMAVLELTLRRDGAKARAWLEQALAIGPASREMRRPLLQVCNALADDPELDLASSVMVRNMVWLHSPRRP